MAKTFDAAISAAITSAMDSITSRGGSKFESFDKAKDGLKDREMFDPSLSEYKVGTVLNFDKDAMLIGIAKVGTRGATVVSVPKGVIGADGKVVYNGAMNIYLSSLRKTIRVTDADGEPVVNEQMAQETVTGKGNALWESLQSCTNEAQILDAIVGKTYIVDEIRKGYGPANFVKVGDNNVAQGHKLSSLPLLKEI